MNRVRTGIFIYGDQNTGKSHSVLELSKLGKVYYINMDNKVLESGGYDVIATNVKDYFRFMDKLDMFKLRGMAAECLNDGMNYRKVMNVTGLGEKFVRKVEGQLNDGSYAKFDFLVIDGFTNCFHTWKGAVTRGLAKDAFGENLDACEPGSQVKVGRDGKVQVSHERLLRMHRSGWSGWERIGQLVNDAFDKVFEVAMECNVDVIMIGNQKDIEDRDGDDVKVVGVMPAFAGSVRHSYGAHFKHIGWVRRAKTGNEFPGLVRFISPAKSSFNVHCRASDGLYRELSKRLIAANGDVMAGEIRLEWEKVFGILDDDVKRVINIKAKPKVVEQNVDKVNVGEEQTLSVNDETDIVHDLNEPKIITKVNDEMDDKVSNGN